MSGAAATVRAALHAASHDGLPAGAARDLRDASAATHHPTPGRDSDRLSAVVLALARLHTLQALM